MRGVLIKGKGPGVGYNDVTGTAASRIEGGFVLTAERSRGRGNTHREVSLPYLANPAECVHV